jgi:hypothetical protein
MEMNKILLEIRKDNKWILNVINSCDSPDQLKSCYNLIKSWSIKTKSHIDNYKCPFYKYNDVKKLQSSYKLMEIHYYKEIDKRLVEKLTS